MKTVDVVVVGGGINGVGVAQALAIAGFSVTLLEKNQIGKETSANSSKLIHGGLRYLESGHLQMVRSSLEQREQLLRLAPDLVHPVAFYIPVYRNHRRGAHKIRAGLSLYSMLSLKSAYRTFKSVPRVYWSQIKGLKLQGLQAVFQYWDAQTDDFALTLAVAQSSIKYGANCVELANIQDISLVASGYQINYQVRGKNEQVRAAAVVNAAGPWVNDCLALLRPAVKPQNISWVQGSHLLIDLPAPQGVIYLESHLDPRVVFVMPWQGKTLIGTTELELCHMPEKPQITEQEIEYLLAIYVHYFDSGLNKTELTSKIIDTYCGVRVLPAGRGNAFSKHREVVIAQAEHQPRFITIYGGKLTAYRTTAQQVLSAVQQQLGARVAQADYESVTLQTPNTSR